MNTWMSRTLLRAALFGGFFCVVAYVWMVESTIELHGIPAGVMGLLVLVPAFLIWFFGAKTRQQQIGRTTFLIPCGFVLLLAIATEFDKVAYKVRLATPRMVIMNDLKQLSLAMLNYQSKHGTLPPATVWAPDGRPLYSWRVLLLPFLDQEQLFKEFHLDEPWDSDHNKTLIERMPRVFAGPEEIAVNSGRTFYQMFVGLEAIPADDTRLKSPDDFSDGVATTILIAEARHPLIWTQPGDLPFLTYGPIQEMGAPRGNALPQYWSAAMVDGNVRSIKLSAAPQNVRPWITRNGKDTPGPID